MTKIKNIFIRSGRRAHSGNIAGSPKTHVNNALFKNSGGNIDPGCLTRVATTQQMQLENRISKALSTANLFAKARSDKVSKVSLPKFSWDKPSEPKMSREDKIRSVLTEADISVPFTPGIVAQAAGISLCQATLGIRELRKLGEIRRVWIASTPSRKGETKWLWNGEEK